MSQELEDRLLKAKVELMSKSPFISTIALSVKYVFSGAVPTAGVAGSTIYLNPKFIATMPIPQLAGLVAHECWHLAFMHASRTQGRDKFLWNVAGDYVINHTLLKDGMELPPCGIYDKKYDDKWSTEMVYDDLIDNAPNVDPDQFMMDIMEGNGDGEGEGTSIASVSEITDIIIRAQAQSQISTGNHAGALPGEIGRMIDTLLNPKLPWQVILNRFLDQRTKEDYSWSRRNRRYADAYLPSLHGHGLGHLTFAIDTSGSINDEELREMLSELKGIRDVFHPEKMTIIDCDAVIHHVHEVDQCTDIMSLTFSGNGGTRFKPVLDYAEKNPTQALVYFTDLYGEANLEDFEVDYPVLWICNSNADPAPFGETVYANP